MGSDGLPEYRLRAADGQPVDARLRMRPEDERDGLCKARNYRSVGKRLNENGKTGGEGKLKFDI